MFRKHSARENRVVKIAWETKFHPQTGAVDEHNYYPAGESLHPDESAAVAFVQYIQEGRKNFFFRPVEPPYVVIVSPKVWQEVRDKGKRVRWTMEGRPEYA